MHQQSSLNAKRLGILCAVLAVLLPTIASEHAEKKDKDSLIVAAHYAPWFDRPEDGSAGGWSFKLGNRTVRHAYTPLLGYYSNFDPNVLSQHISWAKRYGINTFMIEWCGVPKWDFYETLDPQVRSFLSNPDFPEIDFFFVYSIISGLRRPTEETFGPVDFNDRKIRKKFLADFKYAADAYLARPNYLKIKKRPVVYLWAVYLAEGAFKRAVKHLRKIVKSRSGMDIYIIAEEVGWNTTPVVSRTALFDAVMPYAMVKAEGKPPANYALQDSIDEIISQYRYWYNVSEDLGLDFIPGVFPGFDTVGSLWCYDENFIRTVPIIKRSPKSFRGFIVKARQYVDPDVNMLYITSWSEWNEGTNIEPSKEFGFTYLKTLKRALNKQVVFRRTSDVVKFGFKKVYIPDGKDNRSLGMAFDYIEFLDADLKILKKLDVGTSDARKYMGMGWFWDESGWDPAETFVWAGMELKFAALHINLPAKTKFLKIQSVVIGPQTVKIFINSELRNKLDIDNTMQWETHLIKIE